MAKDKQRTSFDLSLEQKKGLKQKGIILGIIRRTGVTSDAIIGSMGGVVEFVARPDVVVMKRHKTTEILPPDGIEVLAGGVGWRWALMTFSSDNGWLERDEDGDWATTYTPSHWFALSNFWEGVGNEDIS